MSNLSPHKSFPGYTGVETPAEVIIHRPIPRRKFPLAGIKKMLCPKGRLDVLMPTSFGHAPDTADDAANGWIHDKKVRKIVFWILVLPLALVLYFIIAGVLFVMQT